MKWGSRTSKSTTSTIWTSNPHWAVRFQPLSTAIPLRAEVRGHGCEVLFHPGGPALVTVETKTNHDWEARYHCGCLADDRDCACKRPRRSSWTSERDEFAKGPRSGLSTLRLPRPGYITIRTQNMDPWRVAIDNTPPAPAPRF